MLNISEAKNQDVGGDKHPSRRKQEERLFWWKDLSISLIGLAHSHVPVKSCQTHGNRGNVNHEYAEEGMHLTNRIAKRPSSWEEYTRCKRHDKKKRTANHSQPVQWYRRLLTYEGWYSCKPRDKRKGCLEGTKCWAQSWNQLPRLWQKDPESQDRQPSKQNRFCDKLNPLSSLWTVLNTCRYRKCVFYNSWTFSTDMLIKNMTNLN